MPRYSNALRLQIPVPNPEGALAYLIEIPPEKRDEKDVIKLLEWLYAADNYGSENKPALAEVHNIPPVTAADETVKHFGYVDLYLVFDENGRPVLAAAPLSHDWAVFWLKPGNGIEKVEWLGETVFMPRNELEKVLRELVERIARNELPILLSRKVAA